MTDFIARIDGSTHTLSQPALCDAWLADGQRYGGDLTGLAVNAVLGRWPGKSETDAVVRLAEVVGNDATWSSHAATPPVAQKLAEQARLQPLDLEIIRHLQHLQHVCHRPRLHLQVDEVRLPVSRARRTPVRAVADLVSHPGDWEHRTLRNIQPSRVLARQIEDEWNLYENRVAVRLVDHLLGYLAERLEELRKIKEIVDASRNYSDKISNTSFRRAHRISELWSSTLDSKTEEELNCTLRHLELAQRDLQALLDVPLYKRVPRRQAVALSLKPTNILVNDPHYRKVAALWRAWVKYGHEYQETAQQRAVRRQREAGAWDRFILHLLVRAFAALGWSAVLSRNEGWELTKAGWLAVRVRVDAMGLVRVSSDSTLCLLPLCADLTKADPVGVLGQVETLDDADGEVVVAHVGEPVVLIDADRASGWSFARRAVLFACSPWGIDSEERMARLLNGWLSRFAVPAYPMATSIRALPEWLGQQEWLRRENGHLVALRTPNDRELSETSAWSAKKSKELAAGAQRAKAAKQAFDSAPLEAIAAFQTFIEKAQQHFVGLDTCPVCSGQGSIQPRPGKQPDGSDATWWAMCGACGSEWGTRSCGGCGHRYRVLVPQTGPNVEAAACAAAGPDWPDRMLGRDVWAQPCALRYQENFRCSRCGQCSAFSCVRCSL